MSLRDLIHPHLCNCPRNEPSPLKCRGPKRRKTQIPKRLPNHSKRRALSMALAYGRDPPNPQRHSSRYSNPHRPSIDCILPVENELSYHNKATIIQKMWRGYRGQLLAEIRTLQLSLLKEKSRPRFQYVLIKRLQQCLIQWQKIASQPRLTKAATRMQSVHRGHSARIRVTHMRLIIARLMKQINYRRMKYRFHKWKLNILNQIRLRELLKGFDRWSYITYVRLLCRSVLLKMYAINRGNVLKRTLGMLYKMMLHERGLEHGARLGVAISRWIRFTSFEQKRKRRIKKTIYTYWKAWTGLQLWRSRRTHGCTIIQCRYRGWFVRSFRYRTCRKIQCFVRQRLSRNGLFRNFIFWLHKEVFYRWQEDAPLWKIVRIKREKRKLYRAAVKRRHIRRARKGKASPLAAIKHIAFDDLIVGMETELEKPKVIEVIVEKVVEVIENPGMTRRSLFGKVKDAEEEMKQKRKKKRKKQEKRYHFN